MGELTGLTVRVPTEADIPAMASVLLRAFGTWPRFPDPRITPEQHLRWKFDNHEVARKIHTVAEIEGRMISVRFRLMQTALIRGRPVLLRQAVDDAVDPDYQGRGVNTAMTRYFNDHLISGDVAMNFSTSVVAHRRFQTGYRTLGRELTVLYRSLGLKALSSHGRADPSEGFSRRIRVREFVVTGSTTGCMVRNEKLEPDALEFLDRPAARVHLTAGDSDWV
jgi:hypothetical protein